MKGLAQCNVSIHQCRVFGLVVRLAPHVTLQNHLPHAIKHNHKDQCSLDLLWFLLVNYLGKLFLWLGPVYFFLNTSMHASIYRPEIGNQPNPFHYVASNSKKSKALKLKATFMYRIGYSLFLCANEFQSNW